MVWFHSSDAEGKLRKGRSATAGASTAFVAKSATNFAQDDSLNLLRTIEAE
jgi:hypothetical protein